MKRKKIEIVAPAWNDKFELPDGSHSVSDIQIISHISFSN